MINPIRLEERNRWCKKYWRKEVWKDLWDKKDPCIEELQRQDITRFNPMCWETGKQYRVYRMKIWDFDATRRFGARVGEHRQRKWIIGFRSEQNKAHCNSLIDRLAGQQGVDDEFDRCMTRGSRDSDVAIGCMGLPSVRWPPTESRALICFQNV